MTRLLVLDELVAGPRETPFAPSPSFRNDWWTRPDAPQGQSVRYFELRGGDADVTRLRIFAPGVIAVQFDRFDASLPTVEVDRIETRVERKYQGYGLAAVNLLRDRFDTSQVVAFSHADGFWKKAGFEQKHRTDGRVDGTATFFVAPPLRRISSFRLT